MIGKPEKKVSNDWKKRGKSFQSLEKNQRGFPTIIAIQKLLIRLWLEPSPAQRQSLLITFLKSNLVLKKSPGYEFPTTSLDECSNSFGPGDRTT